MPNEKHDDPISFERPKIGARAYVAKGPSGWNETFPRQQADAALAAYVKPLDLDELVDMFLTARQLANTPTEWPTVVGFLARTMQTHPRLVPHEVGIAFWARTLIMVAESGAN